MTPHRTPLHQDDPVTALRVEYLRTIARALRVEYLRTIARASLPCVGLGLISQANGWSPVLFALSVTGYLVMLVVAYRWYRWELKALYETHENFTE